MKTLSSFILILLLSAVTLYSQIPRTISFQGVLADAQGNLVPDGNHQLQIVLYDQATNGNQVFIENQTVPVVKGIFNVIIGSVAAIPQSLSFDRAYFLGVSVDGGSELTPRTALTSVPYALRAERANVAESLSPNAEVVTHVNNQSGDVTLLGAGGTTVTNSGNAFTISSTGTGGTGIQGVQNTDGTIAIQNPNGPVATIGIADGSVTPEKINPTGAGSGQALMYNGSSVKWITPSGGGSGVSSLNNANGALTLAASGGATVSTNGNTITVNAGSGSGGTGIQGVQNTDNTLDIINPGGPTATINVKNQGITATKLADGSVTNAKIPAGQVVKSINTLKDDVTLAAGSNVTIIPSGNTLTIAASGSGTSPWVTNGNNISNTNSGNVGIGTSNPTAKLDVANGYLRAQDGANTPPTSGEGVELVSVASSHIGHLISYDRSNSHHRELDIDCSPLVLNVSSGGKVGIGTSTPIAKLHVINDGTCIYGVSTNGYGVVGESSVTNGRGVHGINTSTSANFTVGVWGGTQSTSGYGVFGISYATTGNNYGVYSNGNMGASGTKPFRIDHPKDPTGKYLLHYSSEGPEPLNVYNGNVITDVNGYATITLPDYFGEINKEPRYMLTVINEGGTDFVQAMVVQEIRNNQFAIRTSKPSVKISWEVKAVRNDLWVRAYGAPVEVEKRGLERGKYQRPELYGMPKEMGTDYHPEMELHAPAPQSIEPVKR